MASPPNPGRGQRRTQQPHAATAAAAAARRSRRAAAGRRDRFRAGLVLTGPLSATLLCCRAASSPPLTPPYPHPYSALGSPAPCSASRGTSRRSASQTVSLRCGRRERAAAAAGAAAQAMHALRGSLTPDLLRCSVRPGGGGSGRESAPPSSNRPLHILAPPFLFPPQNTQYTPGGWPGENKRTQSSCFRWCPGAASARGPCRAPPPGAPGVAGQTWGAALPDKKTGEIAPGTAAAAPAAAHTPAAATQ